MLVELLDFVNQKSDYILGEKRIEKLVDFLNGFAVSPQSNLIIAFDRKKFCLSLSKGDDLVHDEGDKVMECYCSQ